jgi:hypothetical protein
MASRRRGHDILNQSIFKIITYKFCHIPFGEATRWQLDLY